MNSEVISPSTHFRVPTNSTGDYRIVSIQSSLEQEKYLTSKGRRVGSMYKIHEYNLRMTPFFKELVNRMFDNQIDNPVFVSVANMKFKESTFLWFRTGLALEMVIQFTIRDERYKYLVNRSDTARIYWEHFKP